MRKCQEGSFSSSLISITYFQASFDVADLKGIDPDIFKTVSHLQGIVHKKIKVDNDR